MEKNQQIKKGIFLAFLTSIVSGVAILYSKLSLIRIKPLILTTSRNLYVALLFLLVFLFTKKREEFRKLKSKEVLELSLIGLIGGGLPFYLFFNGLRLVDPLSANFIHKTLFIWVSILAAIFLKERFSFVYFLSYCLLVVGLFFFNTLPVLFSRGDLMILGATLFWSVENVIAKHVLKRVSSEMVGLFRMGVGSVFLLLSSLVSGELSQLLALDFSGLKVIVVGGSILFTYVYFWYKALKYAPASLVAMILSFSVVVGSILNFSLVGIKISRSNIYYWFLDGLAVLVIFLPEIVKMVFY